MLGAATERHLPRFSLVLDWYNLMGKWFTSLFHCCFAIMIIISVLSAFAICLLYFIHDDMSVGWSLTG